MRGSDDEGSEDEGSDDVSRRRPRGRRQATLTAPEGRSLGSGDMPEKITTSSDGELIVPTEPIIPYIEGDGIGVDIWPASRLVLDAAAERNGRRVEWMEVLAGEKAFKSTGEWLPEATVEAFRDHLIGLKGPLTTPVGGGFRSLNVALRQILDLYVCLRPVRWFAGVPSPVKHPEKVDMVIFRENTEDVYAGFELQEGSTEARQLIKH